MIVASSLVSLQASAKSSKRTAEDLEKIIGGVLTYKEDTAKVKSVQDLIDTELVQKVGVNSTEWLVIALYQYKEEYNYSNYVLALDSYVKNVKLTKATDQQRIALAYSVIGGNESYVKSTINDTVGKLGVMSDIYGLILMNSKDYSGTSIKKEDIVDEILKLGLSDGGWALNGKTSDVDITAMAIQALAPFYEESDVKATVDKALTFLSKNQLKSGDFKSWGVRSCESVAQVITALSALNIDVQTDQRFIKNKKTLLDALMLYRLKDGSFRHMIDGKSNNTATIQAMYSMVAAWRQLKGYDSLYLFSDMSGTGAITDHKSNSETISQSDSSTKSETQPAITNSNTQTSSNTVSTHTALRNTRWVIYCIVIAAVLFGAAIFWFHKKRMKHII